MKPNVTCKQRCLWLIIAVTLIMFLTTVSARGDGPSFLESYADPSNAKHILAVFDSASPNGIYILRSTDGGAVWAKIPAPDGSAVRKGGRQDVSDFFIRQSKGGDKKLLIVYANLDLFRAGVDLRWDKISTPPGNASKLIPTTDPQRFFVVTYDGAASALYRTDLGGQSWTKQTEKLPFDCIADCDLLASPDGQTIVFRAFSGNGYSSRDAGRSWQPRPAEDIAKEFSSLGSSRAAAIKGTPAQIRAARDALSKPVLKDGSLQLRKKQGEY